MNFTTRQRFVVALSAMALSLGCAGTHETLDMGPDHDRPLAHGAVTDSFWETQQTNAEAADFVFYDHEFVGETAELAPGARRHLEQVALRMEHTPFPVLIEQTTHNANPQLDQQRKQTVVDHLARMGLVNIEDRVVVAAAFAEGFTAIEGQAAYGNVIGGMQQGFGRRFGGAGGAYR